MNLNPSDVIHFLLMGALVYFIVLHGLYFFFIILGAIGQKNYHQGIQFGEFKRISESPLTLPISVIIPAFNEEKLIVNTALNILNLRYPKFEVIIVNDGSTDDTFKLLTNRFDLYQIQESYKKNFSTRPIRAIYRSRTHFNLIVIDKENGGRADSINCGVNLSHYPIICEIDADCVLDKDTFLYMARPFLLDRNVIAATGIVKPSNGLIVREGEIISRGIPERLLPLFQVIEYLRSFQWSRVGLSKIGSMLCMPGAFTFVKRDVFIKIGGANTKALIDDFELTVTLQRYIHEHKDEGNFKIAFVPDPGCYTEVPETIQSFLIQRNFWQRTILQSLIWNRDMALNPRYGMAGIFGFPYFFIFEVLSPIVEIGILLLAPIAYMLNMATLHEIALLFVLGILMGSLTSIFALLLQEKTRLREEKTGNLIRLIIAAFTEHFGYHQLHSYARLVGIIQLLFLKNTSRYLIQRIGYHSKE